MRQKVEIQFPVYLRDRLNCVWVDRWDFLCRIWAEINDDDTLTIRYHPSVRRGQRVLLNSEFFTIEAVSEIRGTGLLKLTVSNNQSRLESSREHQRNEAPGRSLWPRLRPAPEEQRE
ncbi:MAG: hypothetical protein ACREQW_06490 [Candidatus Binatia bacterium]